MKEVKYFLLISLACSFPNNSSAENEYRVACYNDMVRIFGQWNAPDEVREKFLDFCVQKMQQGFKQEDKVANLEQKLQSTPSSTVRESDLKEVLKKVHDGQCVRDGLYTFPILRKGNEQDVAKYEEMIKAGIFKKEVKTMTDEEYSLKTSGTYYGGFGRPMNSFEVTSYLPADGMKKYFLKPDDGTGIFVSVTRGKKEKRQLCVATYQVEDIISYTPPMQLLGNTVTEARYNLKMVPFEWTKKLSASEHFKKLRNLEERKVERKKTLRKTNLGWEG